MAKPQTNSDFRLISVTPALSRLVDKIIVKIYIYPSFTCCPMDILLTDQFAFHPTGSTTAALVSVLHNISLLLPSNPYVSVFSFDFSKAFDSVSHSSLALKLSTLDIPDYVCNWLIMFLHGRSHFTCFLGRLSSIAYINAIVVQGSGFGPPSYDVLASDLHPLNPSNIIVKYTLMIHS